MQGKISYSLNSVIEFPTRTKNTTSTAIDNVFINKFKHENYKIYPLINLLTPNVNYTWRTAQLISKFAFYIFIQQI